MSVSNRRPSPRTLRFGRPIRLSGIGYALPALLLVLVFFVLPVASLLLRSVTEPTPRPRTTMPSCCGTTTYLRIFFNTFVVSGLVTVLSRR